jgi:hypothetical protein
MEELDFEVAMISRKSPKNVNLVKKEETKVLMRNQDEEELIKEFKDSFSKVMIQGLSL